MKRSAHLHRIAAVLCLCAMPLFCAEKSKTAVRPRLRDSFPPDGALAKLQVAVEIEPQQRSGHPLQATIRLTNRNHETLRLLVDPAWTTFIEVAAADGTILGTTKLWPSGSIEGQELTLPVGGDGHRYTVAVDKVLIKEKPSDDKAAKHTKPTDKAVPKLSPLPPGKYSVHVLVGLVLPAVTKDAPAPARIVTSEPVVVDYVE